MSFSQDMSKLCKSFDNSFNDRIHFLGRNIHETKELKNNTHKMMNRFHRNHQTMAKNLRYTLSNFTENLCDYVHHLLGRYKRGRMEFHRELQRGHHIFEQFARNSASRRKNFFKDIRTEEQKFGKIKH